MATRTDLLKKIDRKFDSFTAQIKEKELSDPAGALIAATQICCWLLNCTYDYSLKATNALSGINLVDPNAAFGIDLVDIRHRVAVQVTSNAAKQSIQDSAERFRSSNLHRKYDTFIILITQMEPVPGIRDYLSKDKFSLQIMFLGDLHQAVKNLPNKKLNAIATRLDRELSPVDQDAPPTPQFPDPVPSNEFTPEQAQVLSFASLLSADGLNRELFLHGLNPKQQEALDALCRQNWIIQKKPLLFPHPDIHAAVSKNNPLSEDALAAFLDRLWDFEQSWRWYRVMLKDYTKIYRSMAHVFESAAARSPRFAASYARRSAELWMSAGQHEDAKRMLQRALSALDSASGDFPWEHAYLLHLTAFCNSRLGDHEHARQFWKRTLDECMKIPVPPLDQAVAHHNLGSAHHDLGHAYLKLEDHENAREQFNHAKKQFESEIDILESMRVCGNTRFPHSGLAKAYQKLSEVYGDLKNPDQKEYCSLKAISAGEEMTALSDDLLDTLFSDNLPPKHSLPSVPPVSPLFIPSSRNPELKILSRYCQSGQPVFIHGIQGSGKTEVAIQLAHRINPPKGAYMLKYRHIPESRDSLRATILQADFSNYLPQYSDDENQDREYKERMEILKSEYPGTMLLIDNFNPPGKSVAELQKEPTLSALVSYGINLVFITRNRVSTETSLDISKLDDGTLLQMLRDASRSKPADDGIYLELIHIADNGHMLLITMIVQALIHTKTLTPAKLLHAFRHGSKPPAAYLSATGQKDLAHHNRFRFLKILLELSNIPTAAHRTLSCASILPEDGMDRALFSACLPEDQRFAVDMLIKYGYLRCEEDRLTIHPTIREFCLEMLSTPEAVFHDLIIALWNQFLATRASHTERIKQIAGCLSMAADKLPSAPPDFSLMAAWCWNQIGKPTRALQYYGKAQQILEADPSLNLFLDKPKLAKIYYQTSEAYRNLGNYRKALEYLLKAMAIYEQSPPALQAPLTKIYCTAVDIYRVLGDYQQALDFARTNLDLIRKQTPVNLPALAAAYYDAGGACIKLGDYSTAIEYLLQAIKIRKKQPRSLNLAAVYNSIAHAYTGLKQYETALEYRQNALEILEEILAPDRLDLATAYINMGNLFSTLEDHSKALEYKLKAMSIREAALPENHPSLASVYHSVGDTYHVLGYLDQALDYRRRALDIRENVLPENHPDLAASYSIVGYTYLELKDWRKAMEYLLKVLDAPGADRELRAVTNNRLGIAHGELNEHEEALKFFQNALELFEDHSSDQATVYSNIGYTYLRLNKRTEACGNLSAALEINQNLYPPMHPIIQELENALDLVS